MKRLALAGCVCLCGCAMSVMGAEALSAGSDSAAGSEAVIEAAVEPEPAPKDGAQMAADPRYVLLSVPTGNAAANGLYFSRDSVRVTDAVKDSLFVTANVYDARPEGVTESVWQFRMDGDGAMYYAQPDGTYQPLSTTALMPETLAADCIREELADESKRELFIREIQDIAIQKAHLDAPVKEGKETEETQTESPEETNPVSEESTKPASAESKKENTPAIRKETPGEAALWKELEKRVQSVFQKEKSMKPQEERTRIDVVVPPDPHAAYEEKKVETENQTVTVSIQSEKA